MRSKLQYISQGVTAKEQDYNIQQALDNGADWIQLRWKNATNEQQRKLAEKVRALCILYRATYIINDSIVLAQQVDADGVHLGLEDEGIAKARHILGEGKIIGGTTNTIENVLKRIDEGCDYIGLGPYRSTSTKEKLSPILGLEGYRKIILYLKERHIHFPPIYAIGGINLADIPSLLEEGVYGIAISKTITDNPVSISDFKKLLS